MNHIKKYLEYITEKKATKAEVYNKYYNDIEPEIYNKIVSADPSAKGESIGVYTQWLLSLFKNKNLKLEDLYKATEYLKAFKEFHGKMGRGIKDLSGINTLPELHTLVEPFLHKEDAHFSNEEERALVGQYKQIFKNDKYRIIIPLTLKASQYFGQDTEWCTLNTNQFESYTRNQNPDVIDKHCLYIFYTEDPDDRLQFSFDTRQFMDVNDDGIDEREFFQDNKDIYEFFKSHFNVDVYIELPDEIMPSICDKYGLRIDIVELYTLGYDTFEEYKNDNPNWSNEFDIVADGFNYDDNPMDGSMNMSFDFIYNSEESLKKFENIIKEQFDPSNVVVEEYEDYCSNMYIQL